MHQTEQQYFCDTVKVMLMFAHGFIYVCVCVCVCVCVSVRAYIYDLRSNSQAQANAHTQNAPSYVHIDVYNGPSCRVNEGLSSSSHGALELN